MMGFLLLLATAVGIAGIMRVAGLKGPMFTLALAALAFGGAGYALQGRPSLQGEPRAAADRAPPLMLTGARKAFLGQFDNADTWLTMSENIGARGNTQDAAGIMLSAVRQHPGDFKLWVGLGNALSDHGRMLTPSARMAFERAQELAPGHPAPLFFEGLAEARSGNPEAAKRLWQAILVNAPPNASWRPLVVQGLQAIGADEPTPIAKPGR